MRELVFGGRLARRVVLVLALAGVVAATAGTATAARQGVMPRQTFPVVFTAGPGTGPPPDVLGGFFMTPFAQLGGNGTAVTSVPAPFGGNLLFGTAAAPQTLINEQIGLGWATWSSGYTGDVFTNFTAGGPGSQDDSSFVDLLTLPGDVHAFYLYAEPDLFGLHPIRATAYGSSGTTASSGWIPVEGDGGAQFFGFYTTSPFVTLTKIVVTASGEPGADEPNDGFAIGEFGLG
jgi:hypothetical protein